MDQKRLFLAVALSMAALLIYYGWLGKRIEKPLSPAVSSGPAMARSDAEAPPVFTAPPDAGGFHSRVVDEEHALIAKDTEFLELVFSARTGDLKSLGVKEHLENGQERTRWLTQRTGKNVGIFTLLSTSAGEREWVNFERDSGENWIRFTGEQGNVRVSKRYDYHPSSRLVWATFEFENEGSVDEQLEYETTLPLNYDPTDSYNNRFIQPVWLSDGKVRHKDLGSFKKGFEWKKNLLAWSGIRTKYFCLIVKPFAEVYTQRFWSIDPKGIVLSLRPEAVRIKPGERVEHKYLLYAGPQTTEFLKPAGYEFDRVVDMGIFGGISTLIMTVLRFFYRWSGNWGVAIILLTVLIKLVLHPLTEKSLRSMKDLQMLQPEMAKLKEKHKDSPEKLNKAMMSFYKDHKVNPLGGCLPILLQMPIFFALYNALVRAAELRGAHFILWIKDLSQPDKFMALPWTLPVIGGSLHLLPILMGIATVVQQKLSSSQGTQTDQQMIMSIMMPLMLTFIFYSLPSGLVLYWTTNTVLTIIHQQRISSSKPKPA